MRQILCAERNDPERLSKLYRRFGFVLRRIREKQRLTIQGLSALSGLGEDVLEDAEAGKFEMTDKEIEDLRNVYWTLETGQATAADYKQIVDQRLSKPLPDFGSSMTQIREEKQISIGEWLVYLGCLRLFWKQLSRALLKLTDEDSKEVRKAYWALAVLEATPADYRRLLAAMATQASGD